MSFSSFAGRLVIGALVSSMLFGCGSDPVDPEYGFGEADMQNAIVGNWSGTISLMGQTPTALTLVVTQVPAMQPACGSRTFGSPLCVETSSMKLDATLSTADKVFDAVKLGGEFLVIGTELSNGELSLSGPGVTIAGGIDLANTAHDLNISGDHIGSATMKR
jgi:hypothetical protein